MIIVQLTGGIGNQMFQYACGRSVAQRHKDELVLLTASFSSPASRRTYSLHAFNIRAQIRPDWDFTKEIELLWTVQQLNSRFNSRIFEKCHGDLVLRGYWESEKYFAEIKEEIRCDFKFKIDYAVEEQHLAEQMAAKESVGLHVRRTDVTSEMDPKGFVGLGYYQAALGLIERKLNDPFIYVFSDDVEWCVSHLCVKGPHRFLSPPRNHEQAALRDLQLMAKCKHFIIANSTFSWWAAWLGSYPNKLVIAPHQWFRKEGLWSGRVLHTFCSEDLIPETWIRI